MLNPFSNRKVLKRGERAIATVVDMPSLEGRTGPVHAAMVLRIDPCDSAPYEVSDRWLVNGDEGLAVGDQLHVAIDPRNRYRIAIDWSRTREELNPHRQVIRQVTEPGVPVPVTKVRAAVEELDPDHFARRRPARVAPVPEPVAADSLASVTDIAAALAPAADGPASEEASEETAAAEGLADTLERLAALHAAGALTDGEFAAAKRHVLGD
ncbi:MAG: hypothetical protein R2718_11040 [Solirubrobacterales bacterium]